MQFGLLEDISSPRLGRPPNVFSAAQKKLARLDSRRRNEVEGAFGATKRHYGLNLAKLKDISETFIVQHSLVMNLERRLRFLLALFSKSVLHRFKSIF